MKKVKTIYKIFFLLLLVFTATVSCSNEEEWLSGQDGEGTSTEEIVGGAYLSVVIGMPSQSGTRADNTPTGGEEGDGREPGTADESHISDLTVFLFQVDNMKAAFSSNAPLVATVHFESDEFNVLGESLIITKERRILLADGTYQMLAVVNAGKRLLEETALGTRIVDICNHLQTKAWETTAGGAMTNFVMVSKSLATLSILQSVHDKNNPAMASTQLQRLAARIDVIPQNGNEYEDDNAKVTITGIKVLNRLTAATYLVRRVANAIDGTPEYMGTETLTHFVLDPWTSRKTLENLDNTAFMSGMKYTSDTEYRRMPTVEAVIDYTLENTMGVEQQLNGYSTGVMYRTVYLPKKWIDETGKKVNNTEQKSFYSYNNIIYKDAASLTKATGIAEQDFSKHGVNYYENGVCYYPCWIRHSYHEGVNMGIMEFAIVRNNVYKLSVNSFTGLGLPDDEIIPDIPDKQSYVEVSAIVRPWDIVFHPEIIM